MKHLYALLMIFALPFTSCVSEDNGSKVENYVTEGTAVPGFTVKAPDGGDTTFGAEWFAGKKTMIVFFIRGCGDCTREKPKVEAAWAALKDEMDFITIERGGEVTEDPLQYWDAGDLPWFIDPDRSAFLKFANSTVPRFYLVDGDGKVVWMCIENLEEAGITSGEAFVTTIREELELDI